MSEIYVPPWFEFKNLTEQPEFTFKIDQKNYVDRITANILAVKNLNATEISNRINERIEHPKENSLTTKKLQAIKSQIESNTNENEIGNGCIYLGTDFHGDVLSFLGQLVLCGAFNIVKNEYMYYNLNTYEINEAPSTKQIKMINQAIQESKNYAEQFLNQHLETIKESLIQNLSQKNFNKKINLDSNLKYITLLAEDINIEDNEINYKILTCLKKFIKSTIETQISEIPNAENADQTAINSMKNIVNGLKISNNIITEISNLISKIMLNSDKTLPNFIMLPKLFRNENFKGKIIFLGDYIDRGFENEYNLAILNYAYSIKENMDIHFLAGNHEISNNSDPGFANYRPILSHLLEIGALETGLIIDDPYNTNQFISFSHCELSKKNIPQIFDMCGKLLGKINLSNNQEIAFNNLKTIFTEKLNSLYSELKPKFDNFPFTITDYEQIKESDFADIDLFKIKNLIIDTFITYLSNPQNTMYDNPETGEENFFCNAFSNFLDTGGPWFIATRERNVDNLDFSGVHQFVGHTSDYKSKKLEKVIFLDTARSAASRRNSNDSEIANIILINNDKNEVTENILMQFYKIPRLEQDNIYIVDSTPNPSKVIPIETSAPPQPGMIVNGTLKKNKLDKTKAFDSLKRTVKIYSSIEEEKQKVVVENTEEEIEKVEQKSNVKIKNVVGAVLGSLALAGIISAGVSLGILGIFTWPILAGATAIGSVVFGGVMTYNSYKIHQAKKNPYQQFVTEINTEQTKYNRTIIEKKQNETPAPIPPIEPNEQQKNI